MVVESLQHSDVTYFPSIGVCEIGYVKEDYIELDREVRRLGGENNINFDVEDFLLRAVYYNLYHFGSFASYCSSYRHCTDNCIKCPEFNYGYFANKTRQPCSKLMINCTWNEKPFDCCRYFLPIQTTMGKCFLLNSIQLINRSDDRWFKMKLGSEKMQDFLRLEFSKAASITVLNEEDVPHMLLTYLMFNQLHSGIQQYINLNVQNVVNDEGVQDISKKSRRCIFPDENFGSKYKYYSFSVCVTECMKKTQIEACNCTHFSMIYDDGLKCDCLPSCNEHEIKLIGRTYKAEDKSEHRRITQIIVQSLPTQRYRRQAVRNNLDIVVSIGGIMSLYLGASILSLVEFLYFFTIRASTRQTQTDK
ncbi:pickpocket protein 19-like [Contarinia nasturtii]|uniref:pickpocket protein 19-like n=1 Tax=Contarinia nasturtii TaxID=265458 RepID=UPI0012D44915|nr:pickpocket protein 19-like [Contarinia nasturtii]